ncbi:hypothetical protein MUCCIDRAFT_111089 [Mucor lusitanicus CBS 277.49]|uniref:Mediator of RNA polymerase II transcription subunit 12 n=1 Tax=Mucor lusitanicus CBS 277.49 TaxID=747725 RepID=A0A162Z0Y2_MUCCL|nr:hypothetical protein MUCCIDRAFT_111089 [Mucor lusitanicus CBS 277.49]
MAGRHQAQYARYSSSNPSYPNTGGGNSSNSSNLNIPYPPSQNNNAPYNQQQQQQHSHQQQQQQQAYGNAASMASPYSTNSTSSPGGYHSPNITPRNNQNRPLKKYILHPPAGVMPLSKTMPSLGFPGMFPQRPGQDEDIMTESNMRHGFVDRPVVSNEHTCAHDIVYGKLQDDQRLLNELGSFMVDVLQRQSRAGCITGPSSFKPPIRTTLIDSKREQWMQELAGGIVPLKQLARNVPHGFKGEKLLETLAAKQVPFLRATWYIKIVGLSEMSQRSASNAATSVGPQPVQWTATVTTHLKKQLNELMPPLTNNSTNAASPHPTAGTPGRGYKNYNASNHHDNNAPKPWTSPENRARFEHRWSYSVKLARWQYFEGLLDQRTFLKFTLDTLAQSGSFEIMWLVLTGIVQDYVDEYKRNRTLTKLLIETLIKSYSAFIRQSAPDANALTVHYGLQKDIEHLLQSLFLSTPDMFVVPKLYHQYRYLFNSILGDESRQKPSKSLPDVCRVMKEYWTMIKARNEVFCGTLEENEMKSDQHPVDMDSKTQPNDSIPPDAVAAASSTLSSSASTTMSEAVYEERVVHVLDSIGRHVDSITGLLLDNDTWMDIKGHTAKSASKSIFGTTRLQPQALIKLITIMCRWATSESRYGDWKPYLVASILLSWREQDKSSDNKVLLQDALIRFLDDEACPKASETALDSQALDQDPVEKTNTPVIYLFDVLIRLQLFSYQKYLLRLIARGDLEPKRRHVKQIQQCLHHLASFPLLHPAPPYLINQRRVALYGTRSDSDSKEEVESLERLKHLARLAVTGFDHHDTDCLFGAEAQEMTQPVPTDSMQSYELSLTEDIKGEFISAMDATSRYSMLNFTSWLLNEVKRFVVKSIQIGEDNWRVMTSPGSCLLNTRQFVTIIRIMECAKDYLTITEVTLWVLEKSNDPVLYPYIIDTLRKYSNYWKLTNSGTRVANAVWAKHLNLANRGNRERCIMMYMVQLVQEGYQMDDLVRTQLKQDLQVKSKLRGRYSSSVSVKDELVQLAKEPATSSLQLVSESLSVPSQNATGWIGAILESAGEVLRMVAKEKHITEQAKSHQLPFSPALYDFHRIVRAFANVLKDVSNHTTLTGQADEVVIHWLCNNEIVLQDMNHECSWVPFFVVILVAYNVISLSNVVKEFALPWFEQVNRDCQQHYGAEESNLVVFCQNLIALIRLLIIQTSNQPKSEEETPHTVHWQLRVEDFYRLQVQRQSQLASSLDRIEPMFGLMERLVMIATSLPLSSNLLQDLVMLRADLLQITWFRQACLRDLNGVYQRFAAREAEAAMEKRMKKKMLDIVDELIGGNSLVNERQGAIVHETTPDFVDKLHRVFLNVSQWNEAQCRVQVNLLLDNISLSDGHSQNPNNPHILGDDISMDMTPTESVSSSNKDLQSFVYFFYDVVLADGKEESDPVKAQRRFQFFKNLIHELREPVLLELLHHGARLLEGDPSQQFPENVLLMHTTDPGQHFDSVKYAYRSQAFLNITQHMLAENVWSNEKKIELVKTVFGQITRFKNSLSIYRVMQGANVCYADAANALQLVKSNVDMAIALLVTEGLGENTGEETEKDLKLSLQDIRNSLLVRLRLVVPFASLIWEHPKADECDIMEWIKVLVPLLGNPIVHGNGSQERFFEFVLDFVSLLIDEVPKDLKKKSLLLLGSMHNELTSVPAMFHSRVKRIMPFLTHNLYLANTRLASSMLGLPPTNDPQQQQQHLETCLEQSKPWEWLEDYASEPPHDNDAPISLSLFNARKSKRVDNTYVRWFKFGFDEGSGSRRRRLNQDTAHIASIEVDKNKQDSNTDENGFIFIVDDEEMESNTSTPHHAKKRKVEMEEGELP